MAKSHAKSGHKEAFHASAAKGQSKANHNTGHGANNRDITAQKTYIQKLSFKPSIPGYVLDQIEQSKKDIGEKYERGNAAWFRPYGDTPEEQKHVEH